MADMGNDSSGSATGGGGRAVSDAHDEDTHLHQLEHGVQAVRADLTRVQILRSGVAGGQQVSGGVGCVVVLGV